MLKREYPVCTNAFVSRGSTGVIPFVCEGVANLAIMQFLDDSHTETLTFVIHGSQIGAVEQLIWGESFEDTTLRFIPIDIYTIVGKREMWRGLHKLGQQILPSGGSEWHT